MSCSSRNDAAGPLRWLTPALLATGLAACNAIGEGAGPAALTLVSPLGSTAPYVLTECGQAELTAIGHWDGDETYNANVNTVAAWASSNPAVIFVSDGRTPASNGLTYAAGTIVAQAPGAARISAQYLEFSSSLLVTAEPILEQRIVPELTHLAPGSTVTLGFEVRLNPGDAWLRVGPSWLIPHAQAAATIDSTGKLTALSGPENVPFPVEARLDLCGVSATRELRVSPVAALELSYEQPPAQPLPLGLSTLIRVLARFGDPLAEPQDLSDQVEIDLEDTDEDVVRYEVSSDGIALEGLQAGTSAQLTLRYAPAELSAMTERYAFAEIEQQGLRLDPQTVDVSYPDEVQLQAIGRFEDGIERVVTREAIWTVSDDAAATVSSGTFDAGRLTVIRDVDQEITVEAFMTLDERAVSAEAGARITRAD